jgi:hypothetical protein
LADNAAVVSDRTAPVALLSMASGTRERPTRQRPYVKLAPVQRCLIVWPDEHHIPHRSCASDGAVATQLFTSGGILLNAPGIAATVGEFRAN